MSRSRRSRTLNTSNDADTLTNSTARSSTMSGVSAQDYDPRRLTCNSRSLSITRRNNEIETIVRRLEISKRFVESLRQLLNYEIVIVCDDSGSMTTPVDKSQRTRWDELRDIVKTILEIGVIFDSNGVDIYFLNREPILKVKDSNIIDKEFEIPPCGYTPLVPVLRDIFASDLAMDGFRDKKLLVFVATDGIPTNDDGEPNLEELEDLMNLTRQIDRTFVSFLLCTDDPNVVNCFNRWDKTMQNIDVTDDFHTEREKILRAGKFNGSFSKGDHIVKALLGAIDRTIDAWNE